MTCDTRDKVATDKNNVRTVVVGYRKVGGFKRLLAKILKASKIYKEINVTISLDGGYAESVRKIAFDFMREIGKERCEIILNNINLGLRKHIIQCGNLSGRYGAIILFEDDIYPDLHYYKYASEALSFFSCDSLISSISLYSPRYNETANLPFSPACKSGASVYFMQLPCSWGQMWTAAQWNEFKNWFDKNEGTDFERFSDLPKNIANWSSHSWKKYYALFLISTNKYVVYPYRSYATNCGDPNGVHSGGGNAYLNVEIIDAEIGDGDLVFIELTKSNDRYDCFMEAIPETIEAWIPSMFHDFVVDIYGSKPISLMRKHKYAITTKPTAKPLIQYPLTFKPITKNIEFGDKYRDVDATLCLTATGDIFESNIDLRMYAKIAQSLSYYPLHSKLNICSSVAYKIHAFIRKLCL